MGLLSKIFGSKQSEAKTGGMEDFKIGRAHV